jgi:hypothetical protein
MKNGDRMRGRLSRFEDSEEDEDLQRQIHLRRWASHEFVPVIKTAKDRDDESPVTIVYAKRVLVGSVCLRHNGSDSVLADGICTIAIICVRWGS